MFVRYFVIFYKKIKVYVTIAICPEILRGFKCVPIWETKAAAKRKTSEKKSLDSFAWSDGGMA